MFELLYKKRWGIKHTAPAFQKVTDQGSFHIFCHFFSLYGVGICTDNQNNASINNYKAPLLPGCFQGPGTS